MDSGGAGHNTGEAEAFASLEEHCGQVTFADDSKGEILGIVKVGKSESSSIKNVLFVQGLNIISLV